MLIFTFFVNDPVARNAPNRTFDEEKNAAKRQKTAVNDVSQNNLKNVAFFAVVFLCGAFCEKQPFISRFSAKRKTFTQVKKLTKRCA